MKVRAMGRYLLAGAASAAMVFGMAACGTGTNGYLWVLAGSTASNGTTSTITGFKIDNNSGNLKEIPRSPFGVGPNPVQLVVGSGGHFLYVVYAGDGTPNSGGITVLSVGGDGVLTPVQTYQSQGQTPVWIDINGGFLYVLDAKAPSTSSNLCPSLTCGDVTVFGIDSSTGRLNLVQNTSVRGSDSNYLTYFLTGPSPTRMRFTGSSLLVVNGDRTITALASGANGQLTTTANSTQIIDQGGAGNPVNITSITTGGSYLYLTDAANNRVLQYTVSTGGVLQPVTGGRIDNNALAPNSIPVWTFTDSNNKYLYVLNQSNSSTTSTNSVITEYQLNAGSAPTPVTGEGVNPAPVGAGPVCMVEDPSKQYVYTSNQDGTVSGYRLRGDTGALLVLRRGSSFKVTGRPTCLAVSGVLS